MLVKMYSWRFCPFCIRAKRLLEDKGIEYQDIPAESGSECFEEMKNLSGRATVPQIWVGKEHVGGFTELRALNQSGELDTLLAKALASGSGSSV